MIIREASIDDHQATSALYAQVDALHARGRPDAFQEPPEPRSISFLKERLAEVNAAMFVAEIDGAAVGVAFVKLGRPPVVSAEHRHRGIGKALMHTVEGWARDRKVDQIELVVWEFNEEARKFYESIGYATSHRRMFRT